MMPPPEHDPTATPILSSGPVQATGPVEVVETADYPAHPKVRAAARVQHQATDPSLPAQTTFQEDLTFASQREINRIWEWTQAIIALLVVFATMCCGVYAMIYQQAQIPTIIAVAFGTVTGFYFSRTNHAAIGGTGKKPEAPYLGR